MTASHLMESSAIVETMLDQKVIDSVMSGSFRNQLSCFVDSAPLRT